MMPKRRELVNVEIDNRDIPVTAFGGLILPLELLAKNGFLAGLPGECERGQGWTDAHMMLALVLLNIAGFDCVADIDHLEQDTGLCRMVERYEPRIIGMSARCIERRFRGGRGRRFPSARSIHDWLDTFHDAAAEAGRKPGVALIPPLAERAASFRAAFRRLLARVMEHCQVDAATIDLDATIIASGKRESRYTYRAANRAVPGERGYQPLIAFCPEVGVVPHLEMRDGNVPASLDNHRVLDETLLQLPDRIRRVTLRTDGAGYQEKVIRYCNDPDVRSAAARRFGTIALVCGAKLSDSLKAAICALPECAWVPMPPRPGANGTIPDATPAGLECAELDFVSEMGARQKRSHVMRYVVTRRPLADEFGVGNDEIPAQNGKPAYQVRAYFTNFPAPDATAQERANGLQVMAPAAVVRQAHDRCGRGEEVHAMLKNDFAGGMMPAGRFGANAAWMAAAAFALNVTALLRRTGLGDAWRWRRMKAVRARWINQVARVILRGRQVTVKLPKRARHIVAARRLLLSAPSPP